MAESINASEVADQNNPSPSTDPQTPTGAAATAPTTPTASTPGTSSYEEQIATLDVQIEALRTKQNSNRSLTKVFLGLTLFFLVVDIVAPFFAGSWAIYLQVGAGFVAAVSGFIWLAGLITTGINGTELDALYRRKNNLLQLSGFTPKSPEASYFDQLVRINVDNLGEYYTLVKGQTNKSFIASLLIAAAGFVFIVAGLVAGFMNYASPQGTPDITYVGTAAGILTEFTAGVFFFLYSKTVRQLKEYHDGLLRVQNILLSFKIVEEIRDEHQRAQIIGSLLVSLIGQETTTRTNADNVSLLTTRPREKKIDGTS
jgi:hypothetical protein